MANQKRVLLAGFFHETHTFLEGTVGWEDFEIQLGAEMTHREAGGDSPIDGLLEVASLHDWELLPLIDIRTRPGCMIQDDVIEKYWEEWQRRATPELERGVDGIFLILHGASVTPAFPDVEGELLGRIRALSGTEQVPICGVVDLHANFTQKMADLTQGLVAYRKNPHTDSKQAATDGALLLQQIMHDQSWPETYWKHPPVMWPPTGVATAANPMRMLESMAREMEQHHPDIYFINVLAGFSFADTPDTGVSFSVITRGNSEIANEVLNQLCSTTIEQREAGNQRETSFESILPHLNNVEGGPAVLAEPSDNIGGGTPGDGTGMLRYLIEHHIENSAVVINDPAAVTLLQRAQPGERVTLSIGGKGSQLDAGPLNLEVTFLSSSDGEFELEDPHSHLASMGTSLIQMGPCAVVRYQQIQILLTSRKTPPFDLGQLRSQGIIPEELSVIVAKAAVAHHQVYRPIASALYSIETPGPGSSRLENFPYQKINRPIFPLDDVN